MTSVSDLVGITEGPGYDSPARDRLETILGRPVYDMEIHVPLRHLAGKKILVTGAEGSIGSALVPLLQASGCDVLATDIADLDVTDKWKAEAVIDRFAPDVIFHLAGAKHAPLGEEDPWGATEVNTVGTRNVLDAAANHPDTRVVTASTCKACNPETAYGASKLIAERMTLNVGHAVARFYNVVETQENVFDIWSKIPDDEAIPYTDCWRYFLALQEAVGLIVWAAVLRPSRYTVQVDTLRRMVLVASETFPGRQLMQIERRRGDRRTEPLCGDHETVIPVAECAALREILSPHDGV